MKESRTIEAQTLAELIEKAAAVYGDRPAYTWRPGLRALRFTYAEIHQLARRGAALLEANGVRAGDKVVIWAANSPYWVAMFFACQLKGAAAVPLMVQSTPDFVLKIAELTEARLILKSPTRRLSGSRVPVVDLETALASAHSNEYTPGNPGPETPCQILFTSGTTGTPKGVVLKHSNILANAQSIAALDLVRKDDHLVSILPLAHSFEQVASLFTAMAMGLQVTQCASFAGPHVRLNLVEDRPTLLVAVPEFLKLVMQQIEARAAEEGRKSSLDLLFKLGPSLPMSVRRALARPILKRLGGRLRMLISGGSALDPAVGRKWEAIGVYVRQGYGATECSPVITACSMDVTDHSSVGRAVSGVQVRLADDGEILARGPNVVDGYYQRPEETAERFRDGWYYTDDIGAFDERGWLHVKGRKKFLIVTPAGENVYPEDVEAELNAEPEVRDSAVIGWKKDSRFEIHAVLLPRPGVALDDPQSLVERVNRRLQPHQRVQGVSVWDTEDFPRTPTRKAKKAEIEAWLAHNQAPGTTPDLAVLVGAVEGCIAKATGVPASQIRPEMKLEADLKIDSLGRVTLIGVLEEDLGAVLDESQIGPGTTVADLKQMVQQRGNSESRYDFNPGPLSLTARTIRAVGQRLLVWPVAAWLGPMEITGSEHLRDLVGPVLFCPNHTSPIDAAFALRALPARFRSRTAIAAAVDVLYEHPSFRRFAGLAELMLNVYPFDRLHQVRTSLQYTGRLLDRGYSVIIFPEGHLERDENLGQIKGGAGLIAIEMGAPVVPMALTGVDRIIAPDTSGFGLPRRSRVRVAFGAPLRFSSGEGYQEAADRLFAAISALRSTLMSGHPE